ncbi:Rv1733c family protein [Streptomyces lanatus]|uniref:Proline rich protein membrane protein n=1 Tax=Streptomyces lanatus TaxID=66900 RepID=A0ABV1Y2A9_9ACTN|nr:hypothetical protein [Streptomyces lanatus]GHH25365.1 hypothetical protein GCM10018780_77060 [Streptomyces lanatus]
MSGTIPPAQPPPGPRDPWVHPLSLWHWRHNPLRRRSDRLQGWIALGLLLLVPFLGLVATFAIGDVAYRHYVMTAAHQKQTRHLTTAVLTHDAPRHPEPGSEEAKKTRYPATVRFTDPQGRTRTAKTDVLPGLTADSKVEVWVDTDGALTDPPMTAEQIRSRTMGWALLAFLTVALAGTAAYGTAAHVLHRHNMAEWESKWAETAPRWTTFP